MYGCATSAGHTSSASFATGDTTGASQACRKFGTQWNLSGSASTLAARSHACVQSSLTGLVFRRGLSDLHGATSRLNPRRMMNCLPCWHLPVAVPLVRFFALQETRGSMTFYDDNAQVLQLAKLLAKEVALDCISALANARRVFSPLMRSLLFQKIARLHYFSASCLKKGPQATCTALSQHPSPN